MTARIVHAVAIAVALLVTASLTARSGQPMALSSGKTRPLAPAMTPAAHS